MQDKICLECGYVFTVKEQEFFKEQDISTEACPECGVYFEG